MSYHGAIFAGFGGQGVMLMGQVLSLAGMIDNKHVTWIPSYGPEMRGGTANCTVVIDTQSIGSPVVDQPDEVIAMNNPSLAKFEPSIRKNGILILNTSVIDQKPKRKDIHVIEVKANEIADQLGNPKVANMVILGAYIHATKAVSRSSLEQALETKLGSKKGHLVEVNMKAIDEGMKAATQ